MPDEPLEPFKSLLDLQDHDTVIDQLLHRREHLDEMAKLRQIRADVRNLSEEMAPIQTERERLDGNQSELQGQVDSARQRRETIRTRMYEGTVSNPRDLQAMDEEVKHLDRHIADLEDKEIEIMELLEPLEKQLTDLDARRSQLLDEASSKEKSVTEQQAELDAEREVKERERSEVAKRVPEALTASYEQLRKKLGGTGAARLVGGRCMGCHLQLPAMEVDRIKKAPPDTLVLCDQCGRILVR